MKLDLGAGAKSPDGYIPMGHAHGSEIYPLPFDDGSIEAVRCSHALEHFPHGQIADVLKEWVRVLQPGGELRIAVPDFGKIAENYISGVAQPTEGYVMGGQIDGSDYHKALFDEQSLKTALAAAGLVLLRPWRSEMNDDCAALPISLNLCGTKPKIPQPKVRAVMTSPRLGFNDMWNCAMQSLPRLGIELTNVGGAFWDQSLTLVIDRVLAEGECDYLLTIDYDSVFHAGHVAKLIQLAMVHPEADAIAPLQSSRHGAAPLFGIEADDKSIAARNGTEMEIERADFEVDLRQVPQAHFGLTLIKVEALKSMPKPWFLGVPNADGLWDTGKTDPDIYFWRQWEVAGKSLYLAPRVVIGHLELMVRWPDDEMHPTWQAAKDWGAAKRPPVGVWTGEPS